MHSDTAPTAKAAIDDHAALAQLRQRVLAYRDRLQAVPPGDLVALRNAYATYGSPGRRMAASDPAVHIAEGTGCPVPATWFSPTRLESSRVALFLHGGGYLAGDLGMYSPLLEALTRRLGHRILYLDYRLAPEHPFPAALHDALTAFEWLTDQAGNGKAHRVSPSLIGDSCGAGLAIALTAARRNAGLPMPAAIVGLSPTLDFSGTVAPTHEVDDDLLNAEGVGALCDAFRGSLPRTDPRISPVFEDPASLPPMLFQVGSGEYARAAADHFAARAAIARTRIEVQHWPGMPHDWHLWLDELPQAGLALDAVAGFLGSPLPAARSG